MGMFRDSTTDLVTVLKNSLEDEVKETIAQELTEKYVERFRTEIKDLLVESLTKVSFDTIESFRDAMMLNEQLNIHIKVSGEET